MFNSIFKTELKSYMDSYHSYNYYTKMHLKAVLTSFDNCLIKNKLIEKEITLEILDDWVKSLSKELTIQTVYKRTVMLNKFLSSLRVLGYKAALAYVPQYRSFKNTYIPYIFTDLEIKQILDYLDNLGSHHIFNRPVLPLSFKYSPTLIRIMAYCGTRLGETRYIKVSNINLEENIITLRKTKNQKERFIVLHPNLTNIIKKHIKYFNLFPDDYLFPGEKHNSPIGKSTVEAIFDRALLAVGIHKNTREDHSRGPCLHCLRHYFVLKAFKQGVANGISVESQIPYLSYYLGHSSLNETEKYMKFSSELFPEEMEKFDDYSMDIFPEDI